MKLKSILLVLLTVFATVVIMQNSDVATVKILWMEASISKLVLFAGFFAIGLIVGIVIAWPKNKTPEEKTELTESDKEYIG